MTPDGGFRLLLSSLLSSRWGLRYCKFTCKIPGDPRNARQSRWIATRLRLCQANRFRWLSRYGKVNNQGDDLHADYECKNSHVKRASHRWHVRISPNALLAPSDRLGFSLHWMSQAGPLKGDQGGERGLARPYAGSALGLQHAESGRSVCRNSRCRILKVELRYDAAVHCAAP